MILERLFRPRPARAAGAKLYTAVVDQARAPDFYGRLGVPDTVEGRFELYSLHLMLLLDRLKRQGPLAAEVSQALFDTYVAALDDALREMGVGDRSVGKKMRKLGEAFYGRIKSYEAALAELPETAALAAVIGRTVYAEADAPALADLVAYVARQREDLANQPLEALVAGDVTWVAA
ncbi:MAG: ubiquinol-cytochrome C chaperone family protein [Pseudomonadota bacterium]